MGEHRHDLRELEAGEPGEPTEAWIEYPNGERLDCTLERVAENRWVARPPHPVLVRGGEHFRLDRLPAGAAVQFADVTAPVVDRSA
ncbi:hypothetical protein AB0M39_41460 [Streptomyces sp. NPDC051907]|uniref:hypothetical protein n=1 Tax=Streptomyces sp. NPDC051907 TaxID=3155284 RepID=UPI0034270D25